MTAGLNLTHNRFKQLRIPVAPFGEQQRIVAEIEKQFTRLDAAVAFLRPTARRGAAIKANEAELGLATTCPGDQTG